MNNKRKNLLDAVASNIDDFFGVIHVFFQLSRIGLFGTKRSNLQLEKPK
jgi:hypothetical protein